MSPVSKEPRPWGHVEVLCDTMSTHKVKRMTVMPRQRLSLQRHQYRSEHWFIVSGQAEVIIGSDQLVMSAGQGVDIAKGSWHRVHNCGESPLVIIEVQTGSYFGEDDIERCDDDYGRARPPAPVI